MGSFTFGVADGSLARIACMRVDMGCLECGCAVPPEMAPPAECPKHPGKPLHRLYITVPDPFEIDPHKDYGWTNTRSLNETYEPALRANYAANKPLMTNKSVWDLPHDDVCYLVGCGPSLELRGQIPLFEKIQRGAVFCMNEAINHVKLAPGSDTRLYFVCVDWKRDSIVTERLKGNPDAIAILSPTVAPEIARLPWKEIRWIRTAGHAPFLDEITKDWPDLWGYFEGINVSFMAFQVMASFIHPRVLILAGMDCAYTEGRKRIGQAFAPEAGQQYVGVTDCNGKPVMTHKVYQDIAAFTEAMMTFFALRGVRVINATEGGILSDRLTVPIGTRIKLAEIVNLANGLAPAEKLGPTPFKYDATEKVADEILEKAKG